MSPDESRRVLVVANLTASTPAMLEEVKRRAGSGCQFGLMIPPESAGESDWTADDALAMVGRAAHGDVDAVAPGDDSARAVHDAVAGGDYDEIIVCTREEHHHLWFHHNLPERMQDLGVPVVVIPAEPNNWGPIEGFPPDWAPAAANPGGIAGLGNY